MNFLDFLFAILLLIATVILFVGWLSVKYDIVGRDIELKKLQLEIKKLEEKGIQRINKNKQKSKGRTK